MEPPRSADEGFLEAFARVDNAGRWGTDDELGTLNYITPEKRVAAARLVRLGRVVSLAYSLRSEAFGGEEIELRGFHSETADPRSGAPPFAGDHFALEVHQKGVTHVDSISHIGSHENRLYNGWEIAETITESGVARGSVYAQRDGIVTRGILLDIASARGVPWLDPSEEVTASDLALAEEHANVTVSSGDAVVIRTGAEKQLAAHGAHPLSAGPAHDAAEWLHERQVAMYTGDAPDHIGRNGSAILGRVPADELKNWSLEETRFPLPFHQIAIPAMGLVLLDHARVEELSAICADLRRYEFLLVVAPLAIPGGSGSPVNPLAIF